VGHIDGALDGDALGEGVDLPGKYVGSTDGVTVGSLEGAADGTEVGRPAV